MMWITTLAFDGADTKERGDSSDALEMKCVRGSARKRPIDGVAEMIMNTSDAGVREITGVPDTPSRNARGHLMTSNVITVYPDDRVGYAARLMRDYDCGALPIVDRDGRLIGILTDRDISMRLVANESDTHDAIVADCMTDGAFAGNAEDSVRECMRRMSRNRIGGCPSSTTGARW